MDFEKMSGSGPKIVGKIDLDKIPKTPDRIPNREAHLQNLKAQLAGLAAEVNAEFGEGDFLNSDGRITLNGPDAESDAALVEQQEEGFSLEARKSREEWKKDNELNQTALNEMALTLVLHKFLKKDFIVARASSYDDYNNGTDQVIIDKKTGAVVCGFDEVVSMHDDGQVPAKNIKIERKMVSGGTRLKYGATIKDKQLQRESLGNIPAFYLPLTKSDLSKLLGVLKDGNTITEIEKAVFKHLVEFLKKQFDSFNDRTDLHPKLKANLEKFKDSLEKIYAPIISV